MEEDEEEEKVKEDKQEEEEENIIIHFLDVSNMYSIYCQKHSPSVSSGNRDRSTSCLEGGDGSGGGREVGEGAGGGDVPGCGNFVRQHSIMYNSDLHIHEQT